MYVNRRNKGRNRMLLVGVIALAALIGLLFLLASMGGEKPMELVEKPVTAAKTGD